MRLAHKLSLAQFVLIAAVLTAHATVMLRREVRLFENDMTRDHHVTGELVRAAVTDIWQLYGPQRAMQLIQRANAAEQSVQVSFVWQQEILADSAAAGRDHEWAGRLLQGKEVVHIERNGKAPGTIATYLPVSIRGVPQGAVRISESQAEERRFLHTTVLHMVATATTIGLGAVLISFVLGSSFVVRPMSLLVQHARRVGLGELSARLHMHNKDEIGELAGEMDEMSERLEQARVRISIETQGRIATLDQLRHADRLATVGTLASGLAHELGTPLNVVSGRARMIETDAVKGQEALDSARIIREQVERMTRIIRQLLDFSRRGVQEKVTVDLRAAVSQVLTFLRPLAEKQSVVLHPPTASVDPAMSLVDPDQIKQVIANLVLNGIQAMPGGGNLVLEIDQRTAAPPAGFEGPYHRLRVQDEGCGIPAESLPRIFDPFYTTKGVGEGTGLGLSVSHGIVLEHDGWMEVESEPHKGACFMVFLPIAEGTCAEGC